jgi:hypothetical protein
MEDVQKGDCGEGGGLRVLRVVRKLSSFLGRPCLGLAGLFRTFSVSYGTADLPWFFRHLYSGCFVSYILHL